METRQLVGKPDARAWWGVLLAAWLACVSCPSRAEDQLQQTTISFYANGAAVGSLIFPIGAAVPLGAVSDHTRESGSEAQYAGNVEGAIRMAAGQRTVIVGEDVRVSTVAIAPERARAVHDLEAMWLLDQSLRGRAGNLTPEEWKTQTAIDVANARRLADIIDHFGWPGVRFAGAASQGAFMILQHADPAMQRRYLPVFRDAVARHDAMGEHLALLEDRVRIGNGQPQLYGTQLSGKPLHLEPIEDEEHVDVRRQNLGLEPLSQYAQRFNVNYTPKIPSGPGR